MTRAAAHLICFGLVAADLLARAWRIRWLLWGTGHRMSLGRAVAINAVGDAACALSPMRVGGEPARLAGMLRSGVPLGRAIPAVAIEVVAAWPILLLFAAWLGLSFAPDWWRTAAPILGTRLVKLWPWELLVGFASLAAWVLARRMRRRWLPATVAPVSRMDRPLRLWPLLASAPLSLVNIASRAAVLPVLVSTLAVPPDLGVAAFGSLALLYGQLFLPTPSGAGVVDIALLAGMAGSLGGDATWVLGAWRFYTTGAGILLGGVCAATLWLRRRARPVSRGRGPDRDRDRGREHDRDAATPSTLASPGRSA